MLKKCFGCFGEFEDADKDGLPHPYIGATSACWAVYGQILVKEYSDPAYGQVHRLTADAYGAQHIGDQADRRARQSANVHLIALYLSLEKKMPEKAILMFLKEATSLKRNWPSVVQRDNPAWLTVQDVVKATDPSSHAEFVHQWAASVWEAYKDSQKEIEGLYKQVMESK